MSSPAVFYIHSFGMTVLILTLFLYYICSICATCQRSMRTLLRSAPRGRSLTLVRGCLPDCECKGTATFRTDQIFSQLFFNLFAFLLFFGVFREAGKAILGRNGMYNAPTCMQEEVASGLIPRGTKRERKSSGLHYIIYARARDNDETKQADGTTLNTIN